MLAHALAVFVYVCMARCKISLMCMGHSWWVKDNTAFHLQLGENVRGRRVILARCGVLAASSSASEREKERKKEREAMTKEQSNQQTYCSLRLHSLPRIPNLSTRECLRIPYAASRHEI